MGPWPSPWPNPGRPSPATTSHRLRRGNASRADPSLPARAGGGPSLPSGRPWGLTGLVPNSAAHGARPSPAGWRPLRVATDGPWPSRCPPGQPPRASCSRHPGSRKETEDAILNPGPAPGLCDIPPQDPESSFPGCPLPYRPPPRNPKGKARDGGIHVPVSIPEPRLRAPRGPSLNVC